MESVNFEDDTTADAHFNEAFHMLQAAIHYKLPGEYWEQLISTFKNNTVPKCSQTAV